MNIMIEKIQNIMSEWIKPELNKAVRLKGDWNYTADGDGFYWFLNYQKAIRTCVVGCCAVQGGYDIYNDIKSNVNIKIRADGLKFSENHDNSSFSGFSNEKMKELYNILSENL